MSVTPQGETPSFDLLPRQHPLLLILFALLSLGLYVPYWVYTRSTLINRICPEQPIPTNITAMTIAGFVIYLVLMFTLPIEPGAQLDQEYIKALQQTQHYQIWNSIGLAQNILMFFWGFCFCRSLNTITGSHKGDALQARPLYLFIVQLFVVNIVYLQYKINQILDSRRPGLM